MDIKEMSSAQKYRHPWELSRAACLLRELRPFLQSAEAPRTAVDFGAGDLFFCDAFLRQTPGVTVDAIDKLYTPALVEQLRSRVENADRIRTAVSLEERGDEPTDLVLMLDSLEFLEDEAQMLQALSARLAEGRYFIMCMPAFPFLYSRHDEVAKSLRRYDKKYVRRLLAQVPALKPVREHYFYTSLFLVRLMQKLTRASFDEEHRAIVGWRYPETHVFTKLAVLALDLDYGVNALLGRAGLDLPGLSLVVICKKTEAGSNG